MERIIKPSDCLVIVGHGIEKVVGNKTDPAKAPRWEPTRFFYKLDERGFRTGFREKGITANDENVIVAGGTAETLAASELINQLQSRRKPFKLIIFAAGRPAYIQEHEPNNPGITEGRVMNRYLDKKVKVSKKAMKVFLDANRNTQDDIEGSLQTALEKDIRSLTFLTLKIRRPRCEALLEQTLAEHPEYAGLKIVFTSAEDLLRLRYKRHTKIFERILQEFYTSKAYELMKQREQQGIDALKDQSYKKRQIFRGNY